MDGVEWATFLTEFCSPDARRESMLLDTLASLGLVGRVLQLDGARHILVDPPVRSRPYSRPIVLIAHYDRAPETPGANDNSASVYHLLSLLERMKALGDRALWPEVRVIFTDREEIREIRRYTDQGAYRLGVFLKKTRLASAFFCVLDMTGIGDTVILGKGVVGHLERLGRSPDEGIRALHAAQRVIAKKVLANQRDGFFVETETPFSDDLGLYAAGIVASQFSLLPHTEAQEYRRAHFTELPRSWRTMHTAEDTVDRLWDRSRQVMSDLLDLLLAYPIPAV